MEILNDYSSICNASDYIIERFIESGKQNIIVVNIGCVSCIGDILAPLVGTILKNERRKPDFIPIMGDLANPVHNLNMQEKIDKIKEEHSNSFVIGIDASCSPNSKVGDVYVVDSPIRPRSAYKKSENQISIGDVSIKGTIFKLVDDEMKVTLEDMDAIPITLTAYMADIIAKVLVEVSIKYNKIKKPVFSLIEV